MWAVSADQDQGTALCGLMSRSLLETCTSQHLPHGGGALYTKLTQKSGQSLVLKDLPGSQDGQGRGLVLAWSWLHHC